MGASGKWLKSLIGLKKIQPSEQEKVGSKIRKWRPWRTGSGGIGGSKEEHVASRHSDSDSSFGADGSFTAAVATVVRAPTKDFMVIRQEWAAIRIQTLFRAFLARQALRALKAIVRLQAIFRGRQVREQAAVTLRCMQALVRVQARIRASSLETSAQKQVALKLLDKYHNQADPIEQAEGGWCDSPGTVEEVRAKLQIKQEAAIKRERAIAYTLSQQQLRANPSPNSKTNKVVGSYMKGKNSWLEHWMATKPWESRLREEFSIDPSQATTPTSKKHHEAYVAGSRSSFSDLDSVKVKRTNVSTRVTAKPPVSGQFTRSSSGPCAEFWYDESSTSNSSLSSNSETPPGSASRPNYMNLTKSIKAKQRASPYLSNNMQRRVVENVQLHKKAMQVSTGDMQSNAGSDLYSVSLCKDLYPPMHLDRYDWVKS